MGARRRRAAGGPASARLGLPSCLLLAVATLAHPRRASAAADAAQGAATIAAANPLIMLGYQEGARRRARCFGASRLQGLDLHFLPAMGGGGGAYAEPILAGVALRCGGDGDGGGSTTSGRVRVEYDPPAAPPREDRRAVFGLDLAVQAAAAQAQARALGGGSAAGGAQVRRALCPAGTFVRRIGWRPARASGDVKPEGQPLRVGGVTLFCTGGDGGGSVVVEPSGAGGAGGGGGSSSTSTNTGRAQLACPAEDEQAEGDAAMTELEMWHDDVFNGLSVVRCGGGRRG
jgi:hypothetical protein